MANERPKERILVVDDSTQIVDFIVDEVLKPNGFDTLIARDGLEGFRMAHQHQPDLILLDYEMPKLTGVEVLERLQQYDFDIPVILMTGHGSEVIAIEVFRLGVKDYLIKPFHVEEMVERINTALREARLLKELEKLNSRLLIANRHLKMLVQFGEKVSGNADIDAVLLWVLNMATNLTNSEEGSIHIMDEGELVCRAFKPPRSDEAQLLNQKPSDKPLSDPLAIQAVSEQKVKHANRRGRKPAKAGSFVDAVAMPITYGDEHIGVIVLKHYAQNSRKYTRQDTAVIKTLANYTAMAIDSARRPTNDIDELADEISYNQKRIFISYARTDWDPYVDTIVNRLSSEGFHIWIDQEGLEGGQDWLDKINEALQSCDYMILCVTPRALSSLYVKFEYRYFFHANKPLIPVICEPTQMPAELISIHMIQYTELDTLILRLRGLMRGSNT